MVYYVETIQPSHFNLLIVRHRDKLETSAWIGASHRNVSSTAHRCTALLLQCQQEGRPDWSALWSEGEASKRIIVNRYHHNKTQTTQLSTDEMAKVFKEQSGMAKSQFMLSHNMYCHICLRKLWRNVQNSQCVFRCVIFQVRISTCLDQTVKWGSWFNSV